MFSTTRRIRRAGTIVAAFLLMGMAASPTLAFFPQSQPPFPPVGVNPDPPIIVPDPPPPVSPPPVHQTPEPATMALGLIGAGIAYVAKRRKKGTADAA